MLEHTYHGGGKSFPVTEQDRVTVKQNGKQVVIGFNHSRAWQAAADAAKESE